MTFLNPFLLFGAAAIASPIIIHLFMNRRVKKVVWAAMRFLQVSVQKNQKQMNLEDLLLLIMRCALLLLLALALARPAIKGGQAGGIGGGSQTAVIAIDNSYSMALADSGTSRFDHAKKAAEEIIDSLGGSSSVAVIFFSDTVREAIPEPTVDMGLARKIIRDAKLSDRPTDVQPAIVQAQTILKRSPGGGKAIYLITDGQAAGWNRMEDIKKTLADPDVRSKVIVVTGRDENNLSVSNLRLSSAIPAVGEPVRFEAEVSNFGNTEAANVSIRLSIDGEPPCDQGVIDTIPAGTAKGISLFTRLSKPGSHSITAEIDPDALPTDDHRSIALRAMDDIRVLLVDGDSTKEPRETDTFYLRNALTPAAPALRESYYIKTKTISPSELEATKLADYEAVVLANVPDVTEPSLRAIEAYLDLGGGLIIFPGDKTNVSFYNDTLGKKLGLLPAQFGELRGKADDKETFLKLQDRDYEHKIVSIWKDQGAGSLSTAQFYRSYELKAETGHTAKAGEPQTVLKYGDGSPAVMERSWGRGRVIQFSSSADTAWNDLPLRPSFVPLVHRSLGAILDRQDARLNIPVGSTFEFVCDPEWVNTDALVAAPGENPDRGSLRRIGMTDGVPILRYEQTDQAGPYQVTVKTSPPAIIKFATQFDATESKLTSLPETQLDSLKPATDVVRWAPGSSLGAIAGGGGGGGGMEFWTILTILAILVACAELVCGGLFSTSK